MKLSHARGATQDGRAWYRGLTECGSLEKGMANHFSILALRTPWTVWKGKMIEELPRWVGAQYATGDQWRNNSRIHLFQNFPQFILTHTFKGFSIVNGAEVDVFLELPCFFYDSMDVANLISGSSAFSKSSLNIWKFSVHVLLKLSLKYFEHNLTSMWNECNCMGCLDIFWHLSLGLEWKVTSSSPVATAEFFKFAGILSTELSQHHLLGFEIAQLEFHHLH